MYAVNKGARSANTVASTAIFSERDEKYLNGDLENDCIYYFASRHIRASQVTRGAALWARLVRVSMIALILEVVELAGCFAA